VVAAAGMVPMAAMVDIPMPGGWSLSAMWLPTCGQTWPEAAAAFTGVWALMMLPMMLPPLMPALWVHWKKARHLAFERYGRSTMLVIASYLAAWAILGVFVFPVGAGLAISVIRSAALARAMPVISGVVIIVAGAMQFTEWKARRIVCCRNALQHRLVSSAGTLPVAALKHGLRLAIHCSFCCANLMAALFALGVMDLRAMAAVTVAMTIEQCVPWGGRTAQGIGFAAIAAGLVLTAIHSAP
jgi:predicted metal-binding membrane protein